MSPAPHPPISIGGFSTWSLPMPVPGAGTPRNENGFGGDTTPGHVPPVRRPKYPFLPKQTWLLPCPTDFLAPSMFPVAREHLFKILVHADKYMARPCCALSRVTCAFRPGSQFPMLFPPQ